MSIQFSRVRTAVAALLLAAAPAAAAVAPAQAQGNPGVGQGAGQSRHPQHVCAATGHADVAACHAEVMVNAKGMVPTLAGPPGTALTAKQLQAAYNLTDASLNNGAGVTVAIVDAYGYPNLASDLAMYRKTMGLQECPLNTCLKVVNQSGGTSLPRTDVGWAGEQALDVDAVSAICPACDILVVQASSASLANLGAAVSTAAKQPGVVAISNSYGGGDLADKTYGSYYNHPGIAVTASTGDNGYQGASYPASSSFVTAVGGTTLSVTSEGGRVSETAWSGSGSGCSTLNRAVAPVTTTTDCGGRAMADVAAAADPNQGGMAVYYPTSRTQSTWAQVGGTSEASPIIASVYALSGRTGSAGTATAPPVYANALLYAADQSNLNDVLTGSNVMKTACPTDLWCKARGGWDGPTGLGTPNGTGAF